MAEIKWIKITTSIFDDEAIKVIEQMPEGDAILVIWFKLLVQAGIINDSGLVYFKKDIPYTEDMLAIVFHKPVTLIRLALTTFEKFGMIEIADNQSILIRNWEKHQNVSGMEQVREYNRLAKRKQRQKAKELKLLSDSQGQCQGHVKESHETDIDKDIEYIKEEEEEEEKNFSSKNNFENIPLNEMDAEAYKRESKNWRGTYSNVHLTEEQYKKLQTMILSKEKTDEIINDFSENIASKQGNAQPYDEKFPDMHFITCKKYWEYRKQNPEKFNKGAKKKSYSNKKGVSQEFIDEFFANLKNEEKENNEQR